MLQRTDDIERVYSTLGIFKDQNIQINSYENAWRYRYKMSEV